MAYLELPLIMPSALGRAATITGISTAVTGPTADTYMISAFTDDIAVAAVCSTAAVVDIEASCDTQAVVQAGGGTWVPLTNLTGVGVAAKMQFIQGPLTAIRANVKTGLAGNLTLSIKTDGTSR